MESCNDDRTNWPSICLQIKGKDVTGMLAIRYDRGADTYAVDFNASVYREDVTFDELADVIETLIDDDRWIKARVTMIKAAPLRKAA